MNIFSTLFSKEYRHFLKLDYLARRLIYSITLSNLVSPLLGIFISAFIFRQSNDIKLVGIYNLGSFLGLPLAFFINGLLISRIRVTKIYLIATISQALILVPLIFFSWISFIKLFILGLLFGTSSGFYWANRNLFTLSFTKSENRSYFSGLEVIAGEASSIIIPFIMGWFIVFGETVGLYSSEAAYKILFAIALVVLFIAGKAVKAPPTIEFFKGKFPDFKFGSLWNKVRILSFGKGISEGGLVIVPVLMILTLVGKEGVLGTFKSISAIITTLLVYSVARRVKINDRPKVLAIGLTLEVLAASTFAIMFSSLGVIIYYILATLSGPLIWISLGPIVLDAIEYDSKDPDILNRYNNLFDIELFLNSGRFLGAGVFLLLASLVSNAASLRFTLITLATLRFFIFPIANSLSKKTERLKNSAEIQT